MGQEKLRCEKTAEELVAELSGRSPTLSLSCGTNNRCKDPDTGGVWEDMLSLRLRPTAIPANQPAQASADGIELLKAISTVELK